MKVFRSQSNQWSIGIGLRRNTIFDSWRWMLWVNHGFRSWSLNWKMNPPRPAAGVTRPDVETFCDQTPTKKRAP